MATCGMILPDGVVPLATPVPAQHVCPMCGQEVRCPCCGRPLPEPPAVDSAKEA